MPRSHDDLFNDPSMQIRCPHCHHPVEVVDAKLLDDVTCPSCGSNISLVSDDATVDHTPGGTTTSPGGPPKRLGHFELLNQVGIGGFGAVWKARDTVLDRIVALKVPRRGQLNSSEVEYFLRDARAAAQLRHPNIVSVHEVGRDGETVFIASDYIEGANLKEWLSGRPMKVRDAAEFIAQIADAVQHAHNRGVVHRDLKPGNILIDQEGHPHVTDFGLAKRESGEVTMTVDGQTLGTPAYMSPEQARGKAHEADAASDVYSLGVVLFELLTGELPFRGETQMLILQIVNDEPPSIRKLNGHVPRDMETICLKCLEKNPQHRYASARDLRDDLRRCLAGEPVHARRASRAVRFVRRSWARHRVPIAMVLLAVGITTATVVYQGYQRWQSGYLTLGGDVPATVTVLDGQNRLVAQVSAPTSEAVPIPSGDYKLQVTAPGYSAATYQALVKRGVENTFRLPMGDDLLWGPVQLVGNLPNVELIGANDQPAVAQFGEGMIVLIDGLNGQVLWSRNLPDANTRANAHFQRVPDVDGDGRGEVLCCVDNSGPPYQLLSGLTGLELWHRASIISAENSNSLFGGRVYGRALLNDVDVDGTVDIVVICGKGQLYDVNEFWIEAVSGKDGHELWRYPIPITKLADVRTSRIPQPFVDFSPSLHRLSQASRPIILAVFGNRIIGLTPDSGSELWPHQQIGKEILVAPSFANVDETDDLEAIVLYDDDANNGMVHVRAFSTTSGSVVKRDIPISHRVGRPTTLIADLDGDKNDEFIVAWQRLLHVIDLRAGTRRRFDANNSISSVASIQSPEIDGSHDLVMLAAR